MVETRYHLGGEEYELVVQVSIEVSKVTCFNLEDLPIDVQPDIIEFLLVDKLSDDFFSF